MSNSLQTKIDQMPYAIKLERFFGAQKVVVQMKVVDVMVYTVPNWLDSLCAQTNFKGQRRHLY